MKVTCDNCGAVYRIPEEKLTKEVSRATCKRCSHKIVIRKPTASSGGLGSSYSFDDDDDGFVTHEERTVIATVPELQKFDATPPLSVPGGPLPDLDGGANDAPDIFGDRSSPAAPVPPAGAAASTEAESGDLSKANPLATTSSINNTTGAFSAIPLSATSKLEVGSIPIAMVGLSIVGSLLFIADYGWSTSYLTVAGFFMALYGQFAVLMALLDLKKQRAPRPAAVFGVPAAVCVGVFLLLLAFQGKENMAFIERQVIEEIALGDATGYGDWVPVEITTKTGEKTRAYRNKKTNKLSSTRPPGLPKSIESTAVAQIPGQEPALVGPGDGPDLMAEMGLSKTGRRPSSLGGDRLADQRSEIRRKAALKSAKADIRNALTGATSDFQACVERYGNGDLSKLGNLQVSVLPSGKLKSASLPSTSSMRGSELETCLESKAQKVSFPTFDSPEPINVTHKLLIQ